MFKLYYISLHDCVLSVGDSLDSDIGLIRLKPLDFSFLHESIRPICLPTSGVPQYGGVIGTVSGWGTLSSGEYLLYQ